MKPTDIQSDEALVELRVAQRKAEAAALLAKGVE